MTELEIEVTNPRTVLEAGKKNGAYLATFEESDDRILIYCDDELIDVINITHDGYLNAQGSSCASYCRLKKIKKMRISVELE